MRFLSLPLVEELRTLDLTDVKAVDLPSVDCIATKCPLKPDALMADIKKIRSTIETDLFEQKKDVVLVAHSLWWDASPVCVRRTLERR